jgi:hypothetical protein
MTTEILQDEIFPDMAELKDVQNFIENISINGLPQ